MNKTHLIEPKSIEEGNLLYYLADNLGEANLSYDTVKRTYKINYNALIEKFPFNNLITTFKNNDLTIDILLSYLDEILIYNNTSSKTGTIPIMFPLINAKYGIGYISKTIIITTDVTIGIYKYEIYYNYNWLNIEKSVKDIVEPQKLAFQVCDMVRENVKNLFPELITYIEVDFKDDSKKKYDIGIALNNNFSEKQFLIMVEIQENNKNYDKNPNDKNKEYLVNSKGLIIKHFYQDEICDTEYEANFYADLMHTCHEVLIMSSKNYRNKNLLNAVQILSQKKIKELEDELTNIDENSMEYEYKKIIINEWLQLSEDEDNTIEKIKELYEYKIDAYENGNQYNIPLKLIVDNLNLDIKIKSIGDLSKNKQDKFIDKCIIQYASLINGKYYFSYENVYKFLRKLNLSKIEDLINHLTNILFCTQEIYEYYIKIILKYKDSIIDKFKENNSNAIKIIKNNIENQYKLKLKRNKEKIDILENQVKELHKENNIKPKKIEEIQFINNKPIIDEDYCNLYYSDDYKECVSSKDALTALLNCGISETQSIKILQTTYNKNNNKFYQLTFLAKETISNLYFNIKK